MNGDEQLTERDDSLVGTTVADRYDVLARLGEGAMGAVYRAQHVHMQKTVALKVLHPETSSNAEVVKRFEREAIAAGKVVHPNVAGALDFGRLESGCFYLVLEFVQGKSLREVIASAGPMPVDRVLRITEQIASALHAAHSQGIVHRDLKPENVMILDEPPGADLLKVLDFGLAKLSDEDTTDTKLTKMGAVYGTPQYMAPEQASGNPVDHRADLYALGCMMSEMLRGEPPFASDQVMALLIKHMTEAPPPLPESVPPAVRDLVAALLEKDPAARPASAEAVLVRLVEIDPTFGRGSRASLAGGFSPLSRPYALPSSPHVSTAATPEKAAARFGEKVRKVGSLAREWSRRPLTVAGRTFPVGWLALGGAFFVVVGITGTLAAGGDASGAEVRADSGESASTKVVEEAIDPELLKVLDQAKQGLDSALYALEQRSDDDRSTREWMALAQARLIRRRVPEGLSAFAKAIARDPRQAEDKTMLWALRVLAEKDEFAEPVLRFAAEELGSTGADLLFFVWARTSLKTTATTIAGELLTSAKVKANWSKSLSVAMKLRGAETCEDYLSLLPTVADFGDDRTMVRLRELEKTRGCGPSKRDDCYPCLREGRRFAEAMNQAAMRSAPQFDASRKFRFKDE